MTPTAEQLIRDIEDMKIKGAYLITRVALEALALRAQELAAEGQPIRDGLVAAADRLRAAQPSMASVANACTYVLHPLLQANRARVTAEQAHELIDQRSRAFFEANDQAQQQVIEIGAGIVRDGDVIFIHSYTGTLLGMFRRAREHGKQFSVIATESRPYCEGRVMVSELLKLGIPCTLVIDAAMGSYVGRANKSLVGSDSFLPNGAVVNKIGTQLLALACQVYGVPLYAAGSVLKLSIAALQGGEVKMLERPDDGGIAPADVADPGLLRVENRIFDATPGRYFEALITDQGVLPPAAIASFRDHPMLRPLGPS
jgi:ribose 1,5-bisphosphate isomerase